MGDYAGSMLRIMLLSCWGLFLIGPPPDVYAQPRGRGKPAGKLQSPVPGIRFDTGQRASKIPFDLLSNLVLLQVRVNNSRPLWFILDTAANSSVIDARVVKELGLRVAGNVKGTSGGDAIEAGLVPGVSFSLPGVKVFNRTVASIPLDSLASFMGRSIGGIIGYDLLSQFVVEIDYENKTVQLYAPPAYRYTGAGERLSGQFRDKKLFLEVWLTLEGSAPVKGSFAVATGSSGALLLNGPFVASHRLLQRVPKTSPGNTGGVGSLSGTRVGRVENIRVGRFDIGKPIISFSQAAQGARVGAATGDGILGGEVLRRFKLILDYSRRQIILEPNAHLPEAVEEDMSGFEFVAEGEDYGTYVINEIIPNSPAAEAGLREEDELIDIDGRRVAELGFERLRQLLRREGGEYLLGIKRGEEQLRVKLKLRRLR